MQNLQNPISAGLYERAKEVMPGGNTRTTVFRQPHQVYAARGEGCRIVDVDGNVRIDANGNFTSLIHGYGHPAILEAAARQLSLGTCFGMATEAEITLSELLCERLPSVERLRYTNSGTEAVMNAIKAARAFTERPKIAKCEGAYHGTYDAAETSQDANPANWGEPDGPQSVPTAKGTPRGILDDVVVIPLRRQGLVTVQPQSGTYVFELQAGELNRLCELRFALEPAAVQLALENPDSTLPDQLATIVEAMEKAQTEGRVRDYLALDTAFHDTIITASGNSYFTSAYALIGAKMAALRNRLGSDPHHMEKSMREHKEITEAIRARDLEAAARILVRHIARKEGSYWEHLDPESADRQDRTPVSAKVYSS